MQSSQSNPTNPIAEPNKGQPPQTGPQPQTDAEKKALADKAKSESNTNVKA